MLTDYWTDYMPGQNVILIKKLKINTIVAESELQYLPTKGSRVEEQSSRKWKYSIKYRYLKMELTHIFEVDMCSVFMCQAQ